jgi:hypothetical protein
MSTSLFILLTVLISSQAWAADTTKSRFRAEACEAELTKGLGKNYIIGSGHDGNLIATYEQQVEAIMGENGVARQLGLAVPDHQIEFVSGTEMALISAAGAHYPIGHWIDGSQAANARGGTPYEFVTPGVPGCSTCRCF